MDRAAVRCFFESERPDYVFDSDKRVGGTSAESSAKPMPASMGKNFTSGMPTNLYGPNDKSRIGLKSGNRDMPTTRF